MSKKCRKFSLAIPWVVLCVAIAVGAVRLENLVHNLDEERARAIHAECLAVKQSLAPLRDIILYTTEPSPAAAPGDGVAQQRIDSVNASRAKARAEIIPLIPEVKCKR
jgi:hypothetical protein